MKNTCLLLVLIGAAFQSCIEDRCWTRECAVTEFYFALVDSTGRNITGFFEIPADCLSLTDENGRSYRVEESFFGFSYPVYLVYLGEEDLKYTLKVPGQAEYIFLSEIAESDGDECCKRYYNLEDILFENQSQRFYKPLFPEVYHLLADRSNVDVPSCSGIPVLVDKIPDHANCNHLLYTKIIDNCLETRIQYTSCPNTEVQMIAMKSVENINGYPSRRLSFNVLNHDECLRSDGPSEQKDTVLWFDLIPLQVGAQSPMVISIQCDEAYLYEY